MKYKTLKLAIISALGLFAVGCQTIGTDQYGCSGLPDGVICKTPMQIYEMTNKADDRGVYQYETGTSKPEDTGIFKSSDKSPVVQQGLNSEATSLFSKPAYKANSNPMPVLEQPKVLRIWIAPWVDENETLNYPSYKFTEITPRKWNFGGNPQFRNVLPVTAPTNDADFKSPSIEEVKQPNKAEDDSAMNDDQQAMEKQKNLVDQFMDGGQQGVGMFKESNNQGNSE